MNGKRIGDLVRLRYKLTWAKTRSCNGNIALFVIGYEFDSLENLFLSLTGQKYDDLKWL